MVCRQAAEGRQITCCVATFVLTCATRGGCGGCATRDGCGGYGGCGGGCAGGLQMFVTVEQAVLVHILRATLLFPQLTPVAAPLSGCSVAELNPFLAAVFVAAEIASATACNQLSINSATFLRIPSLAFLLLLLSFIFCL